MVEVKQEQLTLNCPECGAVGFKNKAGLNGHRQFKHGIRPTAQLPLEPLDRLVTETELANALMQLDARLYEAIQQVSERQGQLYERLASLHERVEQGASTLKQVSSIAEELPGIRGDILSCKGRLSKLEPELKPEPEPEPKSKERPPIGSLFHR